ncbi:hypothetical protein MTR_7g053250 [Medicago truncatula]|uniref:Uncharacterized protein n=1 Tax=Medicago truncatula TaxID=3880 RepID=A0A072U077_MEDTR|nr:hypothetical protein MTR_7g053250 [Medicago truncatula]
MVSKYHPDYNSSRHITTISQIKVSGLVAKAEGKSLRSHTVLYHQFLSVTSSTNTSSLEASKLIQKCLACGQKAKFKCLVLQHFFNTLPIPSFIYAITRIQIKKLHIRKHTSLLKGRASSAREQSKKSVMHEKDWSRQVKRFKLANESMKYEDCISNTSTCYERAFKHNRLFQKFPVHTQLKKQ